MIDLNQACKLAKEYYEQNTDKRYLSKIYEHEKMWIIYGKTNEVEFGGYGISIDKATAEIKIFTLPSMENFEILDASRIVEVPKDYAEQ